MEQENTQTQIPEWILKEAAELDTHTNFEGEKLPALKFEENKTTEFTVDFSKPFDKWYDEENKVNKAIIPVNENGEDKVWWLNVKNPIYKDVIHAGKEGQTKFKVFQMGKGKATKYSLVKD